MTPEDKAGKIAKAIAMLCGDDYPPDGADKIIASAIREAEAAALERAAEVASAAPVYGNREIAARIRALAQAP